jgi:5-methylcytosine-specific restriction endonuclease McrA
MRIELVVLLITGFFITNAYHDGKYIETLKSWKKYYQMAGIAFAGLSAYLFFKKNPSDTRTLISSASGVIRHLPIDKSVGDLFEPLMKISKNTDNIHQEKVITTGGNSSKRCVSETKKKYVAAKQGWKCGKCQKQLPAWFEIDHTIRLDHNGTNNVDNLVAMCRECHGEKTALENL